jgi:hypothetical protein
MYRVSYEWRRSAHKHITKSRSSIMFSGAPSPTPVAPLSSSPSLLNTAPVVEMKYGAKSNNNGNNDAQSYDERFHHYLLSSMRTPARLRRIVITRPHDYIKYVNTVIPLLTPLIDGSASTVEVIHVPLVFVRHRDAQFIQSIGQCQQLHTLGIEHGPDHLTQIGINDVFVHTSLVNMLQGCITLQQLSLIYQPQCAHALSASTLLFAAGE